MKFKIQLIKFINILGGLTAIIYAATHDAYSLLYVSLLFWFFFGHLGIAVCMHRMLSHKSFKTYKWLETLMIIFSIFSCVGPTIVWVAIHRMHHAHSDLELDPHSPYTGEQLDWKKIFRHWAGDVDLQLKDNKFDQKYVSDLVSSKMHLFIYQYYFQIIITTYVVAFLINPLFLIFVFCLPASLSYEMAVWFNALNHVYGYRNFETKDKSKNNWFLSFVTLGEGWHNNHHANPKNYTTQVKWWEIDPLGLLIKLIKK